MVGLGFFVFGQEVYCSWAGVNGKLEFMSSKFKAQGLKFENNE